MAKRPPQNRPTQPAPEPAAAAPSKATAAPAGMAGVGSTDGPRSIRFVLRGTVHRGSMQRSGASASASAGAGLGEDDGLPLAGHAFRPLRQQRIDLGAMRDDAPVVELHAVVGQDMVRVLLDDGAELRLHPDSARELFLGMAANEALRSGEQPPPLPADTVPVPAELGFEPAHADAAPAATRGAAPRLRIRALALLRGDWQDRAADAAAGGLQELIDSRVVPGVYALHNPRELQNLRRGGGQRLDALPPPARPGQPLLVLVHGTFVDTACTFSALWERWPEVVNSLFAHYGGTLYALEHRTVGSDPFTNALDLVRALPDGAVLHLLTHSRGGLVAEVLAKLAAPSADIDAATFQALGPDMARCFNAAQELQRMLKAKHIQVERIVRVACPARGTLLASGRLDVYLSALAWLLRQAGLPVLPELVDFLNAVAQRRTDPRLLPGLQAMVPGSGLLRWLNDPGEAIPGRLRVVAGDLAADSIGGFFKTLMADAFFWTDNDIVVHTASMYGGARRTDARYVLHRSGEATHFGYFSNRDTVQAIGDALMVDEPARFQPIGPLSWQGDSSSGLRGVARPAGGPAKPAVVVLPGIMGSHLKVGERRIWFGLGLLGGLDELQYRVDAQPDAVRPDGALERYFSELQDYLAETHDVHEFSYDWRLPIERSAQALATVVDKLLDERRQTGQPVRLLAHSMGGLVARTLALEAPGVWQRLFAHPDARLLMLGTPNGGSWAPMQVLSGDDDFGNFVAAVGLPGTGAKARRVMAGMPGLLSLQAGLTDPVLKLDHQSTWKRLADEDLAFVRRRNWWNRWVFPSGDGDSLGEAEFRWGVPPQAVLDIARALRERLDRQAAQDLAPYADRIKLVVGRARRTADGIQTDDAQGFTYREADAGDGRVPQHLALLPGVDTWVAQAEHADLARWKPGFAGYSELLQTGHTWRLDPLDRRDRMRGGPNAATESGDSATAEEAAPRARYRTAHGRRSTLPPPMLDPVLPPASPEWDGSGRTPRPAAVAVRVRNGNLSFVDVPLFIGHYVSLELTGTERVVNERIGGTMAQALNMWAGHYPDRLGMHQAFMNLSPDRLPNTPGQPPAAVVVGLGPEGKLTERELTGTVELAVIDWLQRQHEKGVDGKAGPPLKMAATLIGSGGVGISPAASARCIVQAVVQANAHCHVAGWRPIAELELIELYLDRASEAWKSLSDTVKDAGGEEAAGIRLAPLIATGAGAKRRPLHSGYRGTDYDMVRITARGNGTIEYALDSRRARSEVREQSTQAALVQQLVRDASRAGQRDPHLSRALFRLLVPPGLEPFLRGDNGLILDMNDSVASIPWELLDPGEDRFAGDRPLLPWAVRSGLIRRLQSLGEWGQGRRDSLADDDVLVIGDPLVPEPYMQLDAAAAEAEEVKKLFAEAFGAHSQRAVKLLKRAQAFDIITTLHARDWRVLHIAGHGDWPDSAALADDQATDASAEPGRKAYGGVVLSAKGIYLGPNEIEAMRVVPELVFVNCCHLAKSGDQGAGSQAVAQLSYGEFAAGVAAALIRMGVHCVVAAGWAIEDVAAKHFARHFYRQLLSGRSFGEAVKHARTETYRFESQHGRERSNTWAAYQCYGDPNWRWVKPSRKPLTAAPYEFNRDALRRRYDVIASAPQLILALESLTIDAQSGIDPNATGRAMTEAEWLWRRFSRDLGRRGDVREAFSSVYEACGALPDSIQMLELAMEAADGSATVKAHERLHNLRSRLAYEAFRLKRRHLAVDDPRPQPEREAERDAAADQALQVCEHALEALERHRKMVSTPEAHGMVGSVHKRMAMLRHSCGKAAEEQTHIEKMNEAYTQGLRAAEASGENAMYARQNLLAAQMRQWRRIRLQDQDAAQALLRDIQPQLLQLRQTLEAHAASRAQDVWQHLGSTECELLAAMVDGDNAAAYLQAGLALKNVNHRHRSAGTWRTTFDHWEFVLGLIETQAAGSPQQRLLDTLERMANAQT